MKNIDKLEAVLNAAFEKMDSAKLRRDPKAFKEAVDEYLDARDAYALELSGLIFLKIQDL